MPMLLVLTLREASLVPATQAILAMESLALVCIRSRTNCDDTVNLALIGINECALNLHNCSDDAFCTDIVGGFTCTCEQGYSGNGVTCTSTQSITLIQDISFFSLTDINECSLNTDNCDANAACADTEGSFTCSCREGYNGDGITCTGIQSNTLHSVALRIVSPANTCAPECDDNARCLDDAGTLSCVCIQGFQGDGMTCTSMLPIVTNLNLHGFKKNL